MSKIIPQYSLEFEIERVKYTIGKIDWFNKNGYKVYLPGNLSVKENQENDLLSDEYIKKQILLEYQEKDYLQPFEYINKEWGKYETNFYSRLKEISLPVCEKYFVYLTRYGVGGSYHSPDKIIVNVQTKYSVGLIRTIFHEIIHLVINPLIEKNKIEHWVKERLTDLILKKLVPELSKEQFLPIKTENIDKIFEENYPNIKIIVEKLITK